MAPKNLRDIEIKNITTDFYVRCGHDEEWINQLRAFKRAKNGNMNSILVAETPKNFKINGKRCDKAYVLVDGRRRMDAAIRDGDTHVKARVIRYTNRTDLIFRAVKENFGEGPRRLRKKDYIRTMVALLELGVGIDEIAAKMPYIPFAKQYAKEAANKHYRKKIRAGLALIKQKHLSVRAAAEQVGVGEESLRKEYLETPPDKKKFPSITAALRTKSHSTNQTYGKGVVELIELYDSGEAGVDDIHKAIDIIAENRSRFNQNCDVWIKRLLYAIDPSVERPKVEERSNALVYKVGR